MADLAGQQFGNYKLISYLGDGSFADVYLGEHVYLKKPVAVKVLRVQLPNSDRESFFIEARTVANLAHPHIVQVLDCGVEERVPYLVMNYASHGTLRQRHPEHTVLSSTIVLSYVKQIASALQYAHDRKLIHRDVKPHNILLGPEYELWLSEFGLVIIAHSTMSQVTQNTGGTPSYMAPEQFIGKTCPASDQYALAVMAYEWLCGERPFQGSHSELFNQHTFASVPSLREKTPTISPAIEEVVLTALAKDPRRRFASVQAFANALEQAYLLPGSGFERSVSSSQKELPPMARQPTASFDPSTPTVLSPMESLLSAQDVIAIAPGKFSSAVDEKYITGFSNIPAPIAAFKEPDTPVPPVPPVAAFKEPDTPMPPIAAFKEPDTPVPAVPPQLQASPRRGISRRSVLGGLAGAIVLVSGATVAWKFAFATHD
ncbi:MAG: serine/threonine-protein kinase, partial [Ktedonobacteraceae bacterium]